MESKVGINWLNVKKAMKKATWEPDEMNDRSKRSVFLGSVMQLYPSGKFYTPYANSNIEPCEACANANDGPCDETSPCFGKEWTEPLENPDNHCEVCRDMAYTKQLESEAKEFGYYIESGEGDATDIFIVESKELEDVEDL